MRVAFDDLDVESQCAWALVESYTAAELNNQVHGHEGGDNGGGFWPVTFSVNSIADAVFLLSGHLKQCAEERS